MCGWIYCGDKPVYSDMDEKSFWKFGRMGVFPRLYIDIIDYQLFTINAVERFD